MKLLIAEDDSLHRNFLKNMVCSIIPDLEVIEDVEDGDKAIKHFDRSAHELIILDLQMPGSTGVDVAKHVWKKRPETKILFWSNYAEEAYIRGITRIVPVDSVYGYLLKSAPEERLHLALKGVFLEDQCIVDREVRGVQRRSRNRVEGLTDFEYEALVDLSLGLTDKVIAARRNVSLRGTQSRLQHLYGKLGLDKLDIPVGSWGPTFNSRTRAISTAFARGLLNANSLKQEEDEFQRWLERNLKKQGDN